VLLLRCTAKLIAHSKGLSVRIMKYFLEYCSHSSKEKERKRAISSILKEGVRLKYQS